MQKRLLAVATLAALTLLSACQKPADPPKTEQPPAPPAAAQPAAPAAPAIAVYAAQAPASVAAAGQIPEGGNCSLDVVNGQPAVDENNVTDRTAPLIVSGWAGAEIDGKFPSQTFVLLEGVQSKTTWYASIERSKRPDVAKAMNKPSFDDAGYNSAANATPLPADVYQVKTVLVQDTKAVVCNTKRRIKLN